MTDRKRRLLKPTGQLRHRPDKRYVYPNLGTRKSGKISMIL